MRISIHIKLKSKHPGVAEKDGVLEVSVSSPPVDGRANEELIGLLADYFEVAKSAIEITNGRSSRHKTIEIRPWQKR